MHKHQKESKVQNVFLILMIIIVLFIIISFGYYYIREKQNQSLNNTNINDTTLNDINENTVIEDEKETPPNTSASTDEKAEENEEEDNEAVQELIITKTISPRGFAGASNYNLCLYSDKTVYLIIYNGEGYAEKDISSKQLLAENVEDIYYDENAETMYIVGGNKISDGGVTWIEFK